MKGNGRRSRGGGGGGGGEGGGEGEGEGEGGERLKEQPVGATKFNPTPGTRDQKPETRNQRPETRNITTCKNRRVTESGGGKWSKVVIGRRRVPVQAPGSLVL